MKNFFVYLLPLILLFEVEVNVSRSYNIFGFRLTGSRMNSSLSSENNTTFFDVLGLSSLLPK